MKNLLKKIIASVIILSLVLSLGLNVFLIKPNKAKALVDPVQAVLKTLSNIKEFALDSIAATIKEVMLGRLKQNIYDWGMGRKSDINLPFAVTDLKFYLDDALNRATGEIIEEMRLTNLCSPIELAFGERFRATFKVYYGDRPTYRVYAGCSLNTVINNIEAFVKRPRITVYGWDAWKALKTPNNNIFGSFFLAQDVKIDAMRQARTNAQQKLAANQGHRDETIVTSTSRDKCRETCNSAEWQERNCVYEGPVPITTVGTSHCDAKIEECLRECERQPNIPLQEIVKNPGIYIANKIRDALEIESDSLKFVDEITELVGVFFQALINKATTTGLTTLASARQQALAAERMRAQNRETYAYLRAFSKMNTARRKKDIRSQLVANMDKTIKSLSRSIIGCTEKEIMKFDDYAKHINEFLEANLEALYVGILGINVKPDAVLLDPPYAPYSVYGYSWGEVYPSKVPSKCRDILTQINLSRNTNCSDIFSGLEPSYGQTTTPTRLPQCSDGIDNDGDGLIDYPNDPGCYSPLDDNETDVSGGGGGEWEEFERAPQMLNIIPGFGENTCIPCMYDHDALNCPPPPFPPQRYPGTSVISGIGTSTVWTPTILEQKQAHYNNCRQWYDVTLNRCEECLKAYDTRCARLRTEEDKNRCIERYCGNYADISPHVISPPTDALDFRYKCMIEQHKESCLTCLAEHFVPASYCEQIKDYTARLIVKYPAVVKFIRRGDNKGQFIGLFDQTISDMGKECDDNWDAQPISLALICRALPDFSYRGEKVCITRCLNRVGGTLTREQLIDVTDFRPDENDCGGVKLDVGGKEPFNLIDMGALEARSRCCADFWQKNRANYATCVGAGPTTEEPDTDPVYTLSCTLSADPSSGLAPLNDVDLTLNARGLVEGNQMTYQFDCNNDGIIERIINNTASGNTFTTTVADLCSYPENNITYTASVRVINEFGNSTSCTANIQTTDCEISSVLNPESGIVPVSTDITGRLNNSDAGPFTFQFYCDVPTSGGPVSSWSGATIEYFSDINQYTLNDACNFTSPGNKGIGVSIQSSSSNSSCYQIIRINDIPSIACNANEVLSQSVYIDEPVPIRVEAMPNSSYVSLIHNDVGTNFSYDCYNSGLFNDFSQTIQDFIHQTYPCSYGLPGTYTIGVRVGNTNPANGFSAYNTCRTTIEVQSSSGEPLP